MRTGGRPKSRTYRYLVPKHNPTAAKIEHPSRPKRRQNANVARPVARQRKQWVQQLAVWVHVFTYLIWIVLQVLKVTMLQQIMLLEMTYQILFLIHMDVYACHFWKDESEFTILKWPHLMKICWINSIACDSVKVPTKFTVISKSQVRPIYFRSLKRCETAKKHYNTNVKLH